MKISKAIEIKLQWRKCNYPKPLPDERDADMMSIEALKRLQDMRAGKITIISILLPGEDSQ